jgi:hypothetical protein
VPEPVVIGWREWVGLPSLGVDWIKAKVDTGARSSALHAWDVTVDGDVARFALHPFQDDDATVVRCEAPLVGERDVRSSNGAVERRPVIRAELALLGRTHPVEIGLTRRDEMGFRLLLGRRALRHHYLVDPARSFVGGGCRVAPP